MRSRHLIVLVVAAGGGHGLLGQQLEDRTRTTRGRRVSQSLPDGQYIYNPSLPNLSKLPDPTWVGYSSVPSAYGHPFRPLGLPPLPVRHGI